LTIANNASSASPTINPGPPPRPAGTPGISILYDWKTADIWTWFAKSGSSYNPLYNLMFQAGVPLRYMRICEPFGPEQRQGLWLYHVVEPERWAAMCERVSGVRSGGFYAGHDNHFYGHRKILKPDHLGWREYAMLLLDSMPQNTAEHYRNKIAIYLHWYQKRGMEDIPDTQDGDIGAKDIPSWRRICKVLNNDYWCRALSFSPNKPKHYQRYSERSEGETQGVGHFMQQRIITEMKRTFSHFRKRSALLPSMPFAKRSIKTALSRATDRLRSVDQTGRDYR
jgi:predicted phosphoadenosine phosphosulfate sulfurtransferase